MMKHFAFTLGLMLLITTSVFAQAPSGNRIDYKQKGAPIPPFKIDKSYGGTFTNYNLVKGKPVMIMIFSPQCEHCAYVIDSLKKYADQFKVTQFVALAEERHKEHMIPFMQRTKMPAYPLFKNTGTNKGEFIAAVYTQKILPQIIVYDADHKMVQIFDDNFSFDSLKPHLK